MDAKRILITGAGGFIGRNLTESLSSKYVLYPSRHRDLDLLNPQVVETFISNNNINTIINCAVVGGNRKTNYDSGKTNITSQNLRMFFNIARCQQPGMRIIQLGTGAEYDRRYSTPKISEDHFDRHVPEDDYGFSKYVISKYIDKTSNAVCLRIFGLYGKYEDYTYRFISNAIIKNLLHMPIVINQNVVFDYLYIDDLSSIIECILTKKTRCKHLNVTPTESIDLVSIANIINDIGDSKVDIHVLNNGMNKEYTGNNSRLLDEIGEFKFTSYKSGIQRLYDYYTSIIDTIDVKTIKEDPYIKYCKTM